MKSKFIKNNPSKVFVFLVISFCIMVSACVQKQTSSPDASLPVVPTTNTPKPEPTATPIPPTPIFTDPSSVPEDVSKNYLALLTLNMTTILLDETAESSQSGDKSGMETSASLIKIAALLAPIEDALNRPPATPVLEEAWEYAKLVFVVEKSLTVGWFNDEIDPVFVLNEMPGLLEDVEDMLARAEQALASEYDIERNTFEDIREVTLEDLRAEFERMLEENE